MASRIAVAEGRGAEAGCPPNWRLRPTPKASDLPSLGQVDASERRASKTALWR
jgi:hypothetical protein